MAADRNVPFTALSEQTGIVLQTNPAGTKCYVNGNPIDISYEYYWSYSNSAGTQVHDIKIIPGEDVHMQVWFEQGYFPRVVKYYGSSKPYTVVPSETALIKLTFFSDRKFYKLRCRGTGAYISNNYMQDHDLVELLINPDTGKIVDISDFNYFYDWAVGSNWINVTIPYQDMKFNYSYYDFFD